MYGLYRIFLPLALLSLPAHLAKAQPDDGLVCRQLVQLARSGLYIAHEGGRIARVEGGPVNYDPDARFYYLPGRSNNRVSKERVWHVRTQTRARAAPSADTAVVYRPPVTTQCSNGRRLFAFNVDERFVSLRRYIDHHAAVGGRTDAGLRDYFHLKIRDPGSNQCVRTDDRSVYGNLETIYAFDGVVRTQPKVARAFTFTRSAYAAVATGFASLSSEFAHRSGDGPACFGFSGPLPTYPVSGFFASRDRLARQAAKKWQPTTTSIVIKQLDGRHVSQVVNTTVAWSR